MASRDFDAERPKREPHEFTLGGRTLHLQPEPPPFTFLDDHEYKGLQGVIDFLRRCVVPEDRDALEELLRCEDVFVAEADLAAVSSWYIGVVTGRPTNGSAPSGDGPEPTEDTFGEPSDSPVTVSMG